MKTVELSQLVTHTLDEHKAMKIVDLDVSTLTPVTDRFVICTASSKRHANALADKIIEGVKKKGVPPLGIEGKTEAEWILIDLCDIVVHIMLSETRDFYSLEKLWNIPKIAQGVDKN